MSLHGPRRHYRTQGPTPLKSAWGLRLASSTWRPHSLPQSLRHTPATYPMQPGFLSLVRKPHLCAQRLITGATFSKKSSLISPVGCHLTVL